MSTLYDRLGGETTINAAVTPRTQKITFDLSAP
jgi:hypothetical protein